MLKEERRNHCGKRKEAAVYEGPEGRADQHCGRGVCLQRPLDIPLAVEFGESATDCRRPSGSDMSDTFVGLAANLLINMFGGLLRNSCDS